VQLEQSEWTCWLSSMDYIKILSRYHEIESQDISWSKTNVAFIYIWIDLFIT
jgi:hypothetical protein